MHFLNFVDIFTSKLKDQVLNPKTPQKEADSVDYPLEDSLEETASPPQPHGS